MWNHFNNFFSYTKKERNGILILLLLIILGILFSQVYFFLSPPQEIDYSEDPAVTAFIKEYDSSPAAADSEDSALPERINPFADIDFHKQFKSKKEVAYFEFDPNRISKNDWIKLGFSSKQVDVILNIKSKGFVFRTAEDLKKIYVIGEDGYERLKPYVRITEVSKKTDLPYEYKTVPKNNKQITYKIDINEADSSLWERQRGIGPKLAARIVRYRERLGGFISINQVAEVWGLPDSTFQSLKDRMELHSASPSKINVNSADIAKMGKHPYINFPMAKVIYAYRQQHGDFKQVEDLRKITLMTDSLFTKMEPYITTK